MVDPLSSGALLAQVCDVLAREDTSFESPTEWSGWPGLHAFFKTIFTLIASVTVARVKNWQAFTKDSGVMLSIQS